MTQAEALFLSLFLEIPVVIWVSGPSEAPGADPDLLRRGRARTAAIAAMATLFTHPFAWWAVQWAKPRVGFGPGVAVVEVLVTLVEGWLFTRLVLRRPWWGALLANLFSFGVGLGLRVWVRG